MSNKKEKLILETLCLVDSICKYDGYLFEEMWYLSNEKIMNYSLEMIYEICDFIEKGYTYDEISEIIETTEFDELDLSNDEKSFLRRDAQKTLKIKYKQKGDINYE